MVCNLLESDKDSFEYEDLLTIDNIDWGSRRRLYHTNRSKNHKRGNNTHFIANPYNCNVIDRVLSKDIGQLVTTQKSNLLFEYGKLCNNNIYICFAEDVSSTY